MSAPRRRKWRGFTLTETLVVIVMIALLAAVASPSFVKVMRDLGLSRMTMQFAEIYRRAYVESSDQATNLVIFRTTGGPMLETRRASLDVAAATPPLVSPRGCNSIAWNDPSVTAQKYNFKSSSVSEFAGVGFSINNAQQTRADVCFSRRRAFIRFDEGSFVPMQQGAYVSVTNLKTGYARRVLVPTYGLPRLAQ